MSFIVIVLSILVVVIAMTSYNSSIAAKQAATATTVATAGQSTLGLVIALLVIVLLVVLGLVAYLILTQDRRGRTTGGDLAEALIAFLTLLEEEHRRETLPPSWDTARLPAMEDEEKALMFEEWLR